MRTASRFWLSGLFLTSVLWSAPLSGFADDGGPLSIGGRAVSFSPRDGSQSWYGGAQARFKLPLFFAVDASVDYRRETLGDTKVHDWPVQVSALLYVLPKIVVVQPFILGGVGWYHTTVEGPNGFSDTQTRTGPHAGAGVELTLNSHWFIDATYRYVWLNKIHTENASTVHEDIRDSGHMITAGLNYRI